MAGFPREFITQLINFNAQHGSLQFDKSEFERLPNKQTELQVNDEILKEVLQNLESHLRDKSNTFGEMSFIAAQFKNMSMKTSPLSAAIIEAALTIIINRLNDPNLADDESLTTLKQLPCVLSYIDQSSFYKKGVRVFQIKKKNLI